MDIDLEKAANNCDFAGTRACCNALQVRVIACTGVEPYGAPDAHEGPCRDRGGRGLWRHVDPKLWGDGCRLGAWLASARCCMPSVASVASKWIAPKQSKPIPNNTT